MHWDVDQADGLQAEGPAGAKKCAKYGSRAVGSRQSDGQVHTMKALYGRLSGVLAGHCGEQSRPFCRTEFGEQTLHKPATGDEVSKP